jgi:phosphopantothenoylcysteine decarboxylase/phosphopantothenate--cysteine ligase
MSGSNILFLVTGSIAAYKACEVVSQLVQRGHTVKVAMTAAAQKFVGATTFEALTMQPVLIDLFEPGRALDHTELTRWAHATVVCPATANTINRMAAGIGDDLVGAMLLAHDWAKPLLVAPAMNPRMWSHPATVAAIARIEEWGARLIEPEEGRTACGDVGEGRLADPGQIVGRIEAACAPRAGLKRIVVTSGGTSEPVDSVRVLTNRSTGATGALIARRLAAAGHDVVLVRARSAVRCPGVSEVLFETHADLRAALERLLGNGDVDAVVHAAAVSDFRVDRDEVGKIDSDSSPVLRLAPLPKLIDVLRDMSLNPITVVGFKLTAGEDSDGRKRSVQELFERAGPDFIVHNDTTDRGPGGEFPATVYTLGNDGVIACNSRDVLADALAKLLTSSGAHPMENITPC